MTPRTPHRRQKILAAFLLTLALVNLTAIVTLAPYLRRGYQDFTIFYAAARMVRIGQAKALYDLPAQYREQQQFAPNVDIRKAALPYNHPPFEALLFVPLTYVPYVPAYGIWTAFNLAFLAAAMSQVALTSWRLSAGGPAGPTQSQSREDVASNLSPIFLALAAFAFVPITRAILQGQDSLLLLLLLVTAFCALEKGNDPAAGTALAAGLFKFHLVLPLVLLLVVSRQFRAGEQPSVENNRWRILIGFVPVAALLAAISVLTVGWTGAQNYVRFVLHVESAGAGGALVANMPNLRGIVTTLAGPSHNALTAPITLACSAIVLGLAAWRIRLQSSTGFVFALATVAAILVSYHTLTYDLSLLLPAVIFLFAESPGATEAQAQAGNLFLITLYLVLAIEPLCPHISQFAWPPLILGWIFWKGNGRALSTQRSALSQIN